MTDILLSDNTKVYANKGLVSIRFTDEWELFEGYDGNIYLKEWDTGYLVEQARFTQVELLNLANIMMERWSRFKIAVMSGEVPTKEEK